MCSLRIGALALVFVAVGCSDDSGAVPDASVDAGTRDASPDAADAARDAGERELPDLSIVAGSLDETWYLDWQYFEPGDCNVVETCVGGSGWRRLLRFATQTANLGDDDFYIGPPAVDNDLFSRSECRDIFHFLGYAEHRLINEDGTVVATGHKPASCMSDTEQIVEAIDISPFGLYNCGQQGIQRGWSDVYPSGLNCQWIDISDVNVGDYMLEVEVNVARRVEEITFDNNVGEAAVRIVDDSAIDPTAVCVGLGYGVGRDCGWTLAEARDCSAGATLEAGCGSACGLGLCMGDPMLRVCDGDAACLARNALAWNDNDCDLDCPIASFTCPDSGRISLWTAAALDGIPYECPVTVR